MHLRYASKMRRCSGLFYPFPPYECIISEWNVRQLMKENRPTWLAGLCDNLLMKMYPSPFTFSHKQGWHKNEEVIYPMISTYLEWLGCFSLKFHSFILCILYILLQVGGIFYCKWANIFICVGRHCWGIVYYWHEPLCKKSLKKVYFLICNFFEI